MAQNYDFSGQGIADLRQDFLQLDQKLRKKVMTSALRKAAGELRKIAIKNAKAMDDLASPRSIAKNVNIQFASRSSNKTGDFIMRVGISGGARSPRKQNSRRYQSRRSQKKRYATGGKGGDTYYWRFLEQGTKNISARSFMVKSMNEAAPKVISTFMSTFRQKMAEVTP